MGGAEALDEGCGKGAPGGRREFRDGTGRLWTVWESPIPSDEWTPADEQTHLAGYGVGWLCFQSGAQLRRHRLYAARWCGLSDAHLDRLRELARDVTRPGKMAD
ncbi:MAG: hypothetical protein JO306_16580 [Gemmatimonadetes bacterium]|nr:hypothetical protein [Gemmatimonadota bacterium]